MRTLKRITYILILLALLITCSADYLPHAHAESKLEASSSCIEFIKSVEGFSSKPYYDYGQHTVGYGTKCPTDKYFEYLANGIPKDEAEVLLNKTVANIGELIHKRLIEKYNLTFTQHQFDALVSFSFNLGTSWMTYDSSLRNVILKNDDAEAFIYAFTLYCTAGGNYSTGLITRRLCEANMYLNGIYSKKPNDAYGYVFYEPNGGSLTYQVQGFICENHTIPAVEAVKSGDVFLGWYTDLTGGTQITELNHNLSGKTLFARWQSAENTKTEDSPSTLIKVTGDVVNIRKGPGTNYGIATQVRQNDTLLVSHVTNLSNRKWGKVPQGWICLEYTNYDEITGQSEPSNQENTQPSEETKPVEFPTDNELPTQKAKTGTVRVNDLLRIRSGPGTHYSTIGYLFNGKTVEILEEETTGTMVWGRISRGWISMDYVITDTTPTDPTQDNTTPPSETPTEPSTETQDLTESQIQESTESQSDQNTTKKKGRVIADALRIRTGPGTENPIVGFYYQNQIIVISETRTFESDSWGKTDKGWINMDYIECFVDEHRDPVINGTVKTVIADCLRIRKAIGTENRIAALLYYGDTVIVFETRNVDGVDWGRVEKGWICMDYVE